MGHNDAVFRTSGGARLRALHLAAYLDTQRWRLTKTRMETKAVLEGILRGMVAIELVIRDALALEHRQYMGTDVVDHLVVPGDHQPIHSELHLGHLHQRGRGDDDKARGGLKDMRGWRRR